jgi:uncharacterized protein
MPGVPTHSDSARLPQFPQFKPLEIHDRDAIQGYLAAYRPQTSEWTFTNLFMWRRHYRYHWSVYRDWLLMVSLIPGAAPYGLPPVGPASRLPATHTLLQWLEEAHGAPSRIERADQRLVEELQSSTELNSETTREHFDYVYRTEDLIHLAGRKYHAKRNHLNKFMRSYRFAYEPLAPSHIPACLQLTDNWCQWRRCNDELNLVGEWDAIRDALQHFDELPTEGGVILLDHRVEAFALGELLNDETAVIHIEKANPEIPGMYALINQQFCEHRWSQVRYVNREQDLGEVGLRKAKLSYHPDHLVEKYRVKSV